MPLIHNYWVQAGQMVGPVFNVADFDVEVEFEKIEPMITRTEELANIEKEIGLCTMTIEQAVRKLHPKYTDEQVAEVLGNRAIV